MSSQTLEITESTKVAGMNPTASEMGKSKTKFYRCKDSRGRKLTGLWERNFRFYCQMEVPGKGTRRFALLNDLKQPVGTVPEAVKARSRMLAERDLGHAPGPRRTPAFNDYVVHYIGWLTSTSAKSPLTIKKERFALGGWAEFFGSLRLNQITRKEINAYVAQRTASGEGVSNRTANLDVVALGNLLKFAKTEGWFRGELPTDDWTALKYTAPKRSLVPATDLEKLCAEAVSQVEGNPKYENGQFLADYLKLMAFSGARRQAGLSLRWGQVDWNNRQLTLFTKFDKRVVVDFNEKLEAHLKDMFERRDQSSPWVFPTPRAGDGPGYFANPQKLLDAVKAGAGMPSFKFHDCRHFFASFCVMAGVDTMTIAKWLGHSDGGVLIGKIYGHLNPQHLREAAKKVTFAQPEKTEPPALTLPGSIDLSKINAAELLAMIHKLQTPKIAAPAPVK